MESDITIPVPYHFFETKLNKEARDLRAKVINANINRQESFETLSQNHTLVEVDLSLKCAYLQTKLITPVRTISCQHIEAVDLTALVYSHKVEGKKAQCPTCAKPKPINNWETEVIIDYTMKRILHEVRDDCERVRYILSKKRYYIIESKLEGGASEMFTKIQEANAKKDVKLEDILNAMESKGKPVRENPMIALTCALSSKRMNYPCRFKGCHHIECFDLEELVNRNESTMEWKCTICDVKTKNPIVDIEIDKSLETLCLKHNKTVLEAGYHRKKKTFFISDDDNDPFLKHLREDQQYSIEQKITIVEEQFKSIIAYCAQEPRDSLVEGMVTEYRQSKGNLNEIEIKLLDPLTNLLITFPARTVSCTHLEACDVKTYLVLWANGEPKCPHCNAEYSDTSLEIYIDNFLIKALILRTNYVIYRFKKNLFIPKNEPLQPLLLAQVILDNNETSKVTYESERYKNKESLKFNLICLISGKQMKIPITLEACTHSACFDQEAYMNKPQRPTRCPFPHCGQKIIETNLVQDMVVTEILTKNFQKPSVIYSLKDKNIILEKEENVENLVQAQQYQSILYPKSAWTPSSKDNGLPDFGGNSGKVAQEHKSTSYPKSVWIPSGKAFSDSNTTQQDNFLQNPQFNTISNNVNINSMSIGSTGKTVLLSPKSGGSGDSMTVNSGEGINKTNGFESTSQNPSTTIKFANTDNVDETFKKN